MLGTTYGRAYEQALHADEEDHIPFDERLPAADEILYDRRSCCMVTAGAEDPGILAILGEFPEDEDQGDIDVAPPSREPATPVTFNGLPVDPTTDHVVVREIGDLDKPFPHETMDVLPGPHDPEAKERTKVCEAREEHPDAPKWSQIHKMDDQKRPGRRKKRRVVRAIKQGRLAA